MIKPSCVLPNWPRLLYTVLACGCAIQAQVCIASLNIAKKHGPGFLDAIRNQPDTRNTDVVLLQEAVYRKYAERLAIPSRYPLADANRSGFQTTIPSG